jgi:hypothetical protein
MADFGGLNGAGQATSTRQIAMNVDPKDVECTQRREIYPILATCPRRQNRGSYQAEPARATE